MFPRFLPLLFVAEFSKCAEALTCGPDSYSAICTTISTYCLLSNNTDYLQVRCPTSCCTSLEPTQVDGIVNSGFGRVQHYDFDVITYTLGPWKYIDRQPYEHDLLQTDIMNRYTLATSIVPYAVDFYPSTHSSDDVASGDSDEQGERSDSDVVKLVVDVGSPTPIIQGVRFPAGGGITVRNILVIDTQRVTTSHILPIPMQSTIVSPTLDDEMSGDESGIASDTDSESSECIDRNLCDDEIPSTTQPECILQLPTGNLCAPKLNSEICPEGYSRLCTSTCVSRSECTMSLSYPGIMDMCIQQTLCFPTNSDHESCPENSRALCPPEPTASPVISPTPSSAPSFSPSTFPTRSPIPCISQNLCQTNVALPGQSTQCIDLTSGTCMGSITDLGTCLPGTYELCTMSPTGTPVALPTANPTANPSMDPSSMPTTAPTLECYPQSLCRVDLTGDVHGDCIALESGICTAVLPNTDVCPEGTARLCPLCTSGISRTDCDVDLTVDGSNVSCVRWHISSSGQPSLVCAPYHEQYPYSCPDEFEEICPSTSSPSAFPSVTPSQQPTQSPSVTPSQQPTQSPSSEPTGRPSGHPTKNPSMMPSSTPSASPSNVPSRKPSSSPTTSIPSQMPTLGPSSSIPTLVPTSSLPTIAPSTSTPTLSPTVIPTSSSPTSVPSSSPSLSPTSYPSAIPTIEPTADPTSTPTQQPTQTPTSYPSSIPTVLPTQQPTQTPTSYPSSIPTVLPSAKPSGSPTYSPIVLGAAHSLDITFEGSVRELELSSSVLEFQNQVRSSLCRRAVNGAQLTCNDGAVQVELRDGSIIARVRFSPQVGIVTYSDINSLMSSVRSDPVTVDTGSIVYTSSRVEIRTPGTLSPTAAEPTFAPTARPTSPTVAPTREPTMSRNVAVLTCDVCQAADDYDLRVSLAFTSVYSLPRTYPSPFGDSTQVKLRFNPNEVSVHRLHQIATSIALNPMNVFGSACGTIQCYTLDILPGDPYTNAPTMLPSIPHPSVSPTIPCDRITSEVPSCPALREYCCSSDTVSTLCPRTCCGLCHDYTDRNQPPPSHSSVTQYSSGISIVPASDEPRPVLKGSFKHGELNVRLKFFASDRLSPTGRWDLIPFIWSDYNDQPMHGIIWGSRTMNENNLRDVEAAEREGDAVYMDVKVYLLSRVPNGEYSLRFAMRPAGASWSRRLAGNTHRAAAFSFQVVNQYVIFHDSVPEYRIPLSTPASTTINIPIKYHADTPVRFAAALFCDESICGEDESQQSRFILSNGYTENLAPASSNIDSEEQRVLVVRIGAGVFTSGYNLFNLRIDMGLFEPNGNGGTKWTETVDRTTTFATVRLLPAAAPGNSSIIQGSQNDNYMDNEVLDSQGNGGTTAHVFLAVALVGLIIVAWMAVQRHRAAARLVSRDQNDDGPPIIISQAS